MHFEFYKIADYWIAIIQLNKNGQYYHTNSTAHKTKSEIIEKTFQLYATL